MTQDRDGRVASPNRLSSSTEPQEGLRPAGFDPARGESEAFAEMMDLPGWQYRDLPNMTREFMEQFFDIAGEENLRWITTARRVWPDGMETTRGQVMISPEGMARIAAFNRDSDGGPKGGDGEAGSVACDDSAGREAASPEPKSVQP